VLVLALPVTHRRLLSSPMGPALRRYRTAYAPRRANVALATVGGDAICSVMGR
jgi:hypothetical protein